MKTFLDQLDIKKNIKIFLEIEPIMENGHPCVSLGINGELFLISEKIKKNYKLEKQLNLMDKIDIKIILMNKNYNTQGKTGILIHCLNIDDFELIPNYTQLARYNNDHDNNNPTNYLGFNGCWELNINEPFYRWKHRITGQGWLLEP